MGTVFGLDGSGIRRKPRRKEEASLQVQVMKVLDEYLPRDAFAFHCPNGGSRNIIEAANLKRQGVRAGIPDIIIIHAGKVFGLELKARKGKMNDAQYALFPKLRAAGMRVEVARSFDEAMLLIKEMGIPIRVATRSYSGAAA